ncbi:MAG: DivIVA domain-containing protein [Clostridiales bacterium]|nr:DivIVA domain-containing protein [Clostridiales bacterium]
MIMPIDIDKKEFSRDKRGYNSREVDEFLDLIVIDYEKILNDNRSMAHKIKSLEKQLEEAQRSDTAMIDTLETAKKLMADISASAERRAELIMRDAELEAENMLLDAKVSVRKLNDEHIVLKNKVERLKDNFKRMLDTELARLGEDEFNLLPDMDRSDIASIDKELKAENIQEEQKAPTIVIPEKEEKKTVKQNEPTITNIEQATISDLSDSLKKMAEEPTVLNDTIILK